MQSGNSQRRAARSPQRLRVWVTRLPRLVARSPRRVARSPSMAAPRDPWGEGSWTTLCLRLGDPNDLSLLIKSRAAPLANGVSNHIRLSSFLPLSSYPPPSGASHISHGPFTLTFPRSDFTYYLSSLSFFSSLLSASPSPSSSFHPPPLQPLSHDRPVPPHIAPASSFSLWPKLWIELGNPETRTAIDNRARNKLESFRT